MSSVKSKTLGCDISFFNKKNERANCALKENACTAFTKRSCTWKDFQNAASLQCKPRYHLATVVLYHMIVVSLLVDRGVLLTKLAGMGITKSSWKCRPQNSRFFLSKSVKKSVKRGVRVLRARSALASHSLVPDLLFDCSRVVQ